MPDEAVLDANNHAFFLTGTRPFEWGRYETRREGGLIVQDDETILIVTGAAQGPVTVRAAVINAKPESLPAGWEEQSFGTLDTLGRIFFYGPDGSLFYPDVFLNLEPNTYGVRVLATGRHKAWDMTVNEPVETYLVEIWQLSGREKLLYSFPRRQARLNTSVNGVRTGSRAGTLPATRTLGVPLCTRDCRRTAE